MSDATHVLNDGEGCLVLGKYPYIYVSLEPHTICGGSVNLNLLVCLLSDNVRHKLQR